MKFSSKCYAIFIIIIISKLFIKGSYSRFNKSLSLSLSIYIYKYIVFNIQINIFYLIFIIKNIFK